MIDVLKPLTNLDGTVLTDGETGIVFTAKIAFANSLLGGTGELPGAERLKRFALAEKIYGAETPIALTSEEKVLIKECCAKMYTTLVYGRVHEILETETSV